MTYITIQPIIAGSCLGALCHSGPFPRGGVLLDTEEDLHFNFERAMEVIESGNMPRGGRTPPSDEELDLLEDWYDGAPFPRLGDNS